MNKPANLKPQETVRSQLRLPAELHERLVASSELSGRSMNAEIVHRLEKSLVTDEFQALALQGADLSGQMGEMLKSLQLQIEQRDKTIQNMAEMMQVSARQIEQLQEIIEKRLLAAAR